MNCADPQEMANAIKCFSCLSNREVLAAQTYLLAGIYGSLAGVTPPTPNQIAAASKCWLCVEEKQLKAMQAYLSCLLRNALGA